LNSKSSGMSVWDKCEKWFLEEICRKILERYQKRGMKLWWEDENVSKIIFYSYSHSKIICKVYLLQI
jgi:hypothetical protein